MGILGISKTIFNFKLHVCGLRFAIGNNVSDAENPLIMRAQEEILVWDELEPILNDLQIAITDCDQKKLRELLIQSFQALSLSVKLPTSCIKKSDLFYCY
jgi:hypothetical protein